MNPLILSPAGLLSFHTSGSILTRCVGRMGEFWNRNFGGKVELDRKKEFRVSRFIHFRTRQTISASRPRLAYRFHVP